MLVAFFPCVITRQRHLHPQVHFCPLPQTAPWLLQCDPMQATTALFPFLEFTKKTLYHRTSVVFSSILLFPAPESALLTCAPGTMKSPAALQCLRPQKTLAMYLPLTDPSNFRPFTPVGFESLPTEQIYFNRVRIILSSVLTQKVYASV